MPGTARDFVKQVHDQDGYWLNYPPGQSIDLGTIVVSQAGVWIPIGNVADHDVSFAVATDQATVPSFTTQSTSGVKVESSATLDPGVLKYLAAGELGARVAFEGASKYLLSLADIQYERIESIEAFWNSVKAAYSVWKWDRDHRVVTSVARAASGTFLGSGASSASYELKANASVSVQGLQAANLAAGFSLVSTASSSVTFAGMENITPLFRLHKVTLMRNLSAAAVGDLDEKMPETAATALQEDDTEPEG